MVHARFQFKAEYARDFIDSQNGCQTITEQVFSSPEELIETMSSLEPYLEDCLANVDGKILQLAAFKTK